VAALADRLDTCELLLKCGQFILLQQPPNPGITQLNDFILSDDASPNVPSLALLDKCHELSKDNCIDSQDPLHSIGSDASVRDENLVFGTDSLKEVTSREFDPRVSEPRIPSGDLLRGRLHSAIALEQHTDVLTLNISAVRDSDHVLGLKMPSKQFLDRNALEGKAHSPSAIDLPLWIEEIQDREEALISSMENIELLTLPTSRDESNASIRQLSKCSDQPLKLHFASALELIELAQLGRGVGSEFLRAELHSWNERTKNSNSSAGLKALSCLSDEADQAEPLLWPDDESYENHAANLGPRLSIPSFMQHKHGNSPAQFVLASGLSSNRHQSVLNMGLRLDWSLLASTQLAGLQLVEPNMKWMTQRWLPRYAKDGKAFSTRRLLPFFNQQLPMTSQSVCVENEPNERLEALHVPEFALPANALSLPPVWQDVRWVELPSDYVDLLRRLRSDFERCMRCQHAKLANDECDRFPPDTAQLERLVEAAQGLRRRDSELIGKAMHAIGTCAQLIVTYDRAAGLLFMQDSLRKEIELKAYMRCIEPALRELSWRAPPTHPKLHILVDRVVRMSVQHHARVLLCMDTRAAILALRLIVSKTSFAPLIFEPSSARFRGLGLHAETPQDAAIAINAIFESNLDLVIIEPYVLERAFTATTERVRASHIVLMQPVDEEPGLKAVLDTRACGMAVYQLLTADVGLQQHQRQNENLIPKCRQDRSADLPPSGLDLAQNDYAVSQRRDHSGTAGGITATTQVAQVEAQSSDELDKVSETAGTHEFYSKGDSAERGAAISRATEQIEQSHLHRHDNRFSFNSGQENESFNTTNGENPPAHADGLTEGTKHPNVFCNEYHNAGEGLESASNEQRNPALVVVNTTRPLIADQEVSAKIHSLSSNGYCKLVQRELHDGPDIMLWTKNGLEALVLLAAEADVDQVWDEVLVETAQSLARSCSLCTQVNVLCSLTGEGATSAEHVFGKFDGTLRAEIPRSFLSVMTFNGIKNLVIALGLALSKAEGSPNATRLSEQMTNVNSSNEEALLRAHCELDPFTAFALTQSGFTIQDFLAAGNGQASHYSLDEVQQAVAEQLGFNVPAASMRKLESIASTMSESALSSEVHLNEDTTRPQIDEESCNYTTPEDTSSPGVDLLRPHRHAQQSFGDDPKEGMVDKVHVNEEDSDENGHEQQQEDELLLAGSVERMAQDFFSRRRCAHGGAMHAGGKHSALDSQSLRNTHGTDRSGQEGGNYAEQGAREEQMHSSARRSLRVDAYAHDHDFRQEWAQLGLAPPPNADAEMMWAEEPSSTPEWSNQDMMSVRSSRTESYMREAQAQQQQYNQARKHAPAPHSAKMNAPTTSSGALEHFRFHKPTMSPRRHNDGSNSWLRQPATQGSVGTMQEFAPSRALATQPPTLPSQATQKKRKKHDSQTSVCGVSTSAGCKRRRRSSGTSSGDSSGKATGSSGGPLSESMLQRMRQRLAENI